MNTAEGLDRIFRPKSVAVIGATARRGTIGQVITHNLVRCGFTGPVYPVNPSAPVIHSIKCWPSILDVPDPVDMAVIVVRKDLVMTAVEDCGKKGVGGVVVVTAGFKEVGAEGARDERELLARVRHYGMRLIGPNCFGVFNTHPGVSMNATFSRTRPLAGRIAFMSQSGSLGEAILNHAHKLGIGFSMFASVGNKADVSGNALLNYWRDDPDVRIILLYLESFGDAGTFAAIAREVTATKPIIALKAGRTAAGARATASHTGALAGGDTGVNALFEHCGILRVNTLEEMFDLAQAFDHQPIPRGNRVAILTNAGGPAILATDAVEAAGLDVVPLAAETVTTLRSFLPAAAATGNPVDMIASATAEHYRMTLSALFADPNVDAVICIFVPPVLIDETTVARAICQAHENADKPMFVCFMGTEETEPSLRPLKDAHIPVYTFPEEIASVVERMGRYHDIRSRPPLTIGPRPAGVTRARTMLESLAHAGRTSVTGEAALEVLAECGIPVAPVRAAHDRAEAEAIAVEFGYPVVLKLDAPTLLHKTEVGGVVTDIRTPVELARIHEELHTRAQSHGLADARVVIQPMVTGGIEMAIGAVRDPTFGPLLMCGFGGVLVEAARDVVFRMPPLGVADAEAMIEQLRARRLLDGFRGSAPIDREPLTAALVAVSQLVADNQLVDELDINPFVARPKGQPARAVDARIILRRPST